MKRSDGEDEDEDAPGHKRPYIARNQILARERFNNYGGDRAQGGGGFSGFGSQPKLDDDDDYDSGSNNRDSDRSRGMIFF